jgi:glycosyltransferase involved in cell wall biosynthesis
MQKKKILHLITGLEIGGAEMMLLKTLPRMQNNFDNRVCCIMGHGPMGKKLEEVGIPVNYLELKDIFDLAIILRFRKLVKEFQPDILVTYLIHADLFGRILGRVLGIKKIICSVRVKLVQIKYLPFLFLDALTSPLVTHYHFNSQTVANMYHKFFFLPKRKITVIPNGLEIEKYDIQIDVVKKKDELMIPQEKIIIGCVAKLRQQKGHKYLISAFVEVLKNNPDALLLLVGDGEERLNIENQINSLGINNNVKLLGNRTDIAELLQIIDIFVLPSLFEGMSNAIMEAMAAGKPIIATNIPENRELIESEKNGILVPTKNFKEFAFEINRLIDDIQKCNELSNSAKNKILFKYDIGAISKKYIYFLDKI